MGAKLAGGFAAEKEPVQLLPVVAKDRLAVELQRGGGPNRSGRTLVQVEERPGVGKYTI